MAAIAAIIDNEIKAINTTPVETIADKLAAQHPNGWIPSHEFIQEIMEQLGVTEVQAMQQIRYLTDNDRLFPVSPSETCIPTFVTKRNTPGVYTAVSEKELAKAQRLQVKDFFAKRFENLHPNQYRKNNNKGRLRQ